MTATWEAGADLVVVGSGVAGLTAALDAAAAGLRVVVVTKDAADAGSTRWAQGGVAVVVGDVPGDSVDAHVADTLTAGAGLCDRREVEPEVGSRNGVAGMDEGDRGDTVPETVRDAVAVDVVVAALVRR